MNAQTIESVALEAAVGWSIVSEPGDEFAGYLRASVGASRSLELIKTRQVPTLLAELQDRGVSDDGHRRFGDLGLAANQALERYLPRLKADAVGQAIRVLQANRGWVVLPSADDWPTSLNDLGWAAPPLLWGVGDRAKLEHINRSVSVVGSRGATGYGEWATTEIVADLVARDFSIGSGGAYGIDGIAHRAALMAKGVTFAVMAGGVNRFYPSGHEELLTQVCGSGAVLAELPPGAAPTKWRFLQRNRLVAALGLVTLVVEAGKRSGSISTANHAMALERPVAAVPGPISSSSSVGTNRLISQSHAELVVCGQDVAYLAGDQDQLNLFGGQQDLGSLETRALDALGSRQKTQQQVASEAGLDQIEVAIALSNLQLLGLAVQREGMWLRASPN